MHGVKVVRLGAFLILTSVCFFSSSIHAEDLQDLARDKYAQADLLEVSKNVMQDYSGYIQKATDDNCQKVIAAHKKGLLLTFRNIDSNEKNSIVVICKADGTAIAASGEELLLRVSQAQKNEQKNCTECTSAGIRDDPNFGLRPTDFPISHWPVLAEKWLTTIGVISK
jgi:hypothetical protein